MGDLYWDGMHGVERSHEEAMTWFAKSAEQVLLLSLSLRPLPLTFV